MSSCHSTRRTCSTPRPCTRSKYLATLRQPREPSRCIWTRVGLASTDATNSASASSSDWKIDWGFFSPRESYVADGSKGATANDQGETMKSNNRLVRLAVLQALTCASGLMLAAPGSASADPAKFDITAQPLPNALQNFAAQAKMQLLYRYDVVSHATATPVIGQLEKHAALERLLQGTGLVAVYSDANTATIRVMSATDKAGASTKPASATGDKSGATDSPPRTSTADA